MGLFDDLFGKPVAENIVNENLSAIASVVNDAIQNCSQEVNQSIYQNVLADHVQVAENLVLTAEQTLILKQDCMQSEKAVTQLDQSLQAVASQTAKSIAQMVQLSAAKAKNVMKINAEIASSIKNRFVQHCSQESKQIISQNVTLLSSTFGGSVIIQADNYAKDMISCSTTGSTIAALKASLISEITQNATAKVENLFGPFFIAIVVIVGIIALFLFLPSLFRGRTTAKQAPAQQDDGALSLLAAFGSEAPGAGGVAAQALSARATPSATPTSAPRRAMPTSAPRRAMPTSTPRRSIPTPSARAMPSRATSASRGMGSLRSRAIVSRRT